ncbi:MAG: class I SAM-dependent methyltransferase [Clostridia bacterium]|nr:class I SAM-dependent methyltransferase [Clostridia bacterium]
MAVNKDIDNGRNFDWGRASEDYAKYRDIYPEEFYEKIAGSGVCIQGQRVLDLGTGTGVLPRNMARFGASFTGADISENQIREARRLSREQNLDIEYVVSSAEKVDFPDNTFDVVTACQCFMYFDQPVIFPHIYRMLKPGGRFVILFLAWLPDESKIAMQSEDLVLKYNPSWTGGRMQRHEPVAPECARELFDVEQKTAFDIDIPFTRESWNGRIRACRGVDASLPDVPIMEFDREHRLLLENTAPEAFYIPHYATILILKAKRQEPHR